MNRDGKTLKPEGQSGTGIAQQMMSADTPTFWRIWLRTGRAAVAARAHGDEYAYKL